VKRLQAGIPCIPFDASRDPIFNWAAGPMRLLLLLSKVYCRATWLFAPHAEWAIQNPKSFLKNSSLSPSILPSGRDPLQSLPQWGVTSNVTAWSVISSSKTLPVSVCPGDSLFDLQYLDSIMISFFRPFRTLGIFGVQYVGLRPTLYIYIYIYIALSGRSVKWHRLEAFKVSLQLGWWTPNGY
jgi:hypothetical protein